MQLHHARRSRHVCRQRLVACERAMAPDNVIRRLPRKVGLRIGRGDERRVYGVGCERGLVHAPFGAA